MSGEVILVGDVGGTNVRFALAEHGHDNSITLHHVDVHSDEALTSFDAYLERYLSEKAPGFSGRALFALAGPPKDREVRLTNRDSWPVVSARTLENRFGLKRVELVNDFAAMGRSVVELPDSDFHTLHAGTPLAGAPLLVSGPGTGIGIATLIPLEAGGYHVLTGEGGHATFASANDREEALVSVMRRHSGNNYVYRELVLAGMGLNPVMRALAELDGIPFVEREPQEVLDLADAGDPFCVEVCEIRTKALMQMLGDVALTNGTRGGVVVCGGVAERLVHWLERPDVVKRFWNRGKQVDFLKPIPIRLLQNSQAPLIGAAALLFERN